MFYSLVGLIQPAKDENEANMNICEMNNIIYETEMHDAWVAAGVFETDEIEEFMEQLQKTISQFCNEYKEKCENV